MRQIVILGLLLGLGAWALAEETPTSALINQALDKKVKQLELDTVLPEVLKSIDNQTGVRIEPTRAVYELLPWGEETKVHVKIQNQTLRDALGAITRTLGLTWSVGEYEVDLKPTPALARLGRRATVAELQALDLLSSTPIALAQERVTVQQLVDAIDGKLTGIKSPALAVELRTGDATNPQAGTIQVDHAINVPRNATVAEALEELVQQTDATWYPWGKNIVIVPKQEQVRMQLNKPITAHFNGTEIGEVLSILSERSGIPFTVEAGAIQRVPVDYRNIRLQLENATIRQVLDNVRGVTGLDYVVRPDGLYIWNQNPNPSAPRVAGATDPVVATLELDGGLQLFLRESQVPGDVRAFLKYKTEEQLARLRKRMKDERFVPATQPATQSTEAQAQ